MKWEFNEYGKSHTRSDPSSPKFFRDLTLEESLIREFVQNSLDARLGSEPVKIIIKDYDVSKDDIRDYIDDLEGHLHSCDLSASEDCRIVTLEDFNTRGLDDNNQDDFFYKDNINHKQSGGGSHGIGKAVFNNSSEIKTFFAYSLFAEKNKNPVSFSGQVCDQNTHFK